MSMTIYHNPRCTKSRETLAQIEAAGQTPEIRLYLKEPPSEAEVRDILLKLGLDNPRDMMRTGEKIYKELGLKGVSDSDALIAAMVENPILIERPIVIRGDEALISRPSDKIQIWL